MSLEKLLKGGYYLVLPLIFGSLGALASYLLIANVDPINGLYTSFITSPGPNLRRPDNLLLISAKPSTPQDLGEAEDVTILPRRIHGELATLLDKAGARGLIFDYSFTKPRPDNDRAFRNSLKSLRKLWVVFGLEQSPDDRDQIKALGGDPDIGIVPHKRSAVLEEGPIPRVYEASLFATKDQGQRLVGFQPVQKDLVTQQRLFYIGFLGGLLASGIDTTKPPLIAEDRLTIDNATWQLRLPKNKAIGVLDPDDSRPVNEIDYAQALSKLRAGDFGDFKDKIVLVGLKSGEEDRHVLADGTEIYGVDFVAEALSQTMIPMVNVVSTDNSLIWFFAAIFSGAAAFGIQLPHRNFQILVPLVAIALALFLVPSFIPVVDRGTDQFYILLAILCAICLSLITFSIVQRRQDFRVPGMVENATVMFLDVHDSTTLVREIGGQEYQRLLGSLNTLFAAILANHGGILERTTGDGFIAVFRPFGHVHHAQRCFDCAQELLALRDNSAHGAIEYSIGFESGPISGGYVWEDRRRVWSSSGATVNLAQRLQSGASKASVRLALGQEARRHIQTDCILDSKELDLKGFEMVQAYCKE